jgi:hypothetical protein
MAGASTGVAIPPTAIGREHRHAILLAQCTFLVLKIPAGLFTDEKLTTVAVEGHRRAAEPPAAEAATSLRPSLEQYPDGG